MLRHWPALALILSLAAVACDRPSQSAGNDTTGSDGPPPDTAAPATAVNPGWNAADGPILFVATGNPGEARAVAPTLVDADGTPLVIDLSRSVTLISRDGRLITGRITRLTPHDGLQCLAWPTASVIDGTGSVPSPWAVGLLADGATPLPLDSVAAFARTDSIRLASDLARLASALKDDTLASFRGLPLVVREMRRFRPAPGTEAVVADIARTLATEANPREERLFLVAERAEGRPWRAAYVTRASGPEDAVQITDVLAAFRLGDGRTVIVLALESSDRSRFALLERRSPGRWALRWTSAETDC